MSASAAIGAVRTTYDTVLSHASIRVQRLPRTVKRLWKIR